MSTQTILKFHLNLSTIDDDSVLSISMPQGAQILHLDGQCGTPCLWALCPAYDTVVDRQFRCIGTGQTWEASDTEQYIGTVLLYDGAVVVHVFEIQGEHIPCTQ